MAWALRSTAVTTLGVRETRDYRTETTLSGGLGVVRVDIKRGPHRCVGARVKEALISGIKSTIGGRVVMRDHLIDSSLSTCSFPRRSASVCSEWSI